MYQNRKYFGMTGSQIGIVAGLGALVLCLFGVLGYLIFSGRFNLGRGPQLPPTPAPTVKPFSIPTITPTALPTAIPYEQLIPTGWTQHRTALVEIWLPSEFRESDAQLFLTDPSNAARREIQFTTSPSELYRKLVGIFYEPLTAESLDDFLDIELQKLPPEILLTERRNDSVNSTPVVRLLFEQRIENVDANALVFVFLDGETVWYVEYAAEIKLFYESLAIFEQSVQTFRFVK